MRTRIRRATLACCLAIVAAPCAAQPAAGWYPLDVPGGRATLRAVGVDDARERSAVMVELIRRFMFATTAQAPLEASIRAVPHAAGDSLVLPMPLAPAAWSSLVFERTIPAPRLFAEILLDPSARLLFHGLAGLDRDTLVWIQGQDDLLRRLYRNADALKSFAMFAPAIRIANGAIELPGGALARDRWSAILDARVDQPDRFIGRLFADRAGRTAGLFALTMFADEERRRFLLGEVPQGFARLVASFAQCYPSHSNDYPVTLRSHDPGLLLMDIAIGADARIAGPWTRSFWRSVFASKDLATPPAADDLAGEPIDAAGLIDVLCTAAATDRAATFATWLAGGRVFRDLDQRDWPAAVLALRVRRQFPSVFMAIEHAGLRAPAVFVAAGTHAARLDRLSDLESTPITLGQFQGALALTLTATAARTFEEAVARQLIVSLSKIPLRDGRYDRAIARWLNDEWIPAAASALRLSRDLSAEQIVTAALAGPSPGTPQRVSWEGAEYVVDFPAAARQRLREVRARQGGMSLDQALAPSATDEQLARVLASWAYAPHLGAADGGALVGGDSSVRHDLGLRAVNRTRYEQRW